MKKARRKATRAGRRPARGAKPEALPTPGIPWSSPGLLPALEREIDLAWAHWATAADCSPQIEDAPVVALLLKALREARRRGDGKALGMLDAGARAALDQMAPGIAAETHARYLADGTLAPGVTVEDLMPKRLQRKGAGRRGDRADAAAFLAEHMDLYLTKASRRSASSGAPLEPLTAQEMAQGFVHSFAPQAGPIGRQLKGRGLLPLRPAASYDAKGLRPGSDLDVKIKAVTAAFDDQLSRTEVTTSSRRWLSGFGSLGTSSTGEDLVRVGLRALGMNAEDVKHLYDAASKRRSRKP